VFVFSPELIDFRVGVFWFVLWLGYGGGFGMLTVYCSLDLVLRVMVLCWLRWLW
jgi:hypothetical protein